MENDLPRREVYTHARMRAAFINDNGSFYRTNVFSFSSRYAGHLCVQRFCWHTSRQTPQCVAPQSRRGCANPAVSKPSPGEMFAHAEPTSNGIAVPPQIMNHNGRLRALHVRVVALSMRPSRPAILLHRRGRKGTRRVRDYTEHLSRRRRGCAETGTRRRACTRQLELK